MCEQIVEFSEEKIYGPEIGVVFLLWEVRAAAAADLVVEDYGDGVGACQVGYGEKVVVRDTGTAVEEEKRAGGSGRGMGTVNLVPCLAVFRDGRNGEWDFTLCDLGGSHGGRRVGAEDKAVE